MFFNIFLGKNSADIISNAVTLGENGSALMTATFRCPFGDSWMAVLIYEIY